MPYADWTYRPYNPYTYPQTSYSSQTRIQQPVNGLIRVTGMEGAKAYPLPPNSNIALFDGNEDILYVKYTDGAGFPTIRVFEFHEIAPKMIEAEPVQENVSKDDISALVSKLDAMKEELDILKTEVENGKQPVSEQSRQSIRK